jgi:predicted RNase H-like nuclease (RuvC/YqgF family)
MKYLSLIILLFLSKFTNGQNAPRVFTTFQNVAVFDDFSYSTSQWDQKNSSTERLIISDTKYRIERIKDSYFSISLAKDVPAISDFEIITSIEVERNQENKLASGGIILKAQKTGNGALILEINAKKQYRFRVMKSGVMTSLFSDKNNGWIKSANLRKKGVNEIRVATKGNEYDLYINNVFERSLIETNFKSGQVGFYASAKSTITAHVFILKINGKLSEVKEDKIVEEPKETEEKKEEDDTYTQLVKVFKEKIDKQQAEIERLTDDLNVCKANLTLDTSSAKTVKVLSKENKELKTNIEKLESEISQVQKRLSYLESMKEDIESQTNGDLILHLTKLLSDKKEENDQLKQEKFDLQKEISELRRRN